MNRDLLTFGQRLKYARLKRGMSQIELAKAVGMGQSDISKMEKGRTEETPAIARLARSLRVPVEWLELGDGPEPDWDSPQEVGRAHLVSLSGLQAVYSMTLEQLKMKREDQLPRTFRLCIENNMMSPRVQPGAWVHFMTELDPRPGDGVLVRDRLGDVQFREYRAGRPGCWEAHADNPKYAPLDSERDALEVIAVLTAVEARWG